MHIYIWGHIYIESVGVVYLSPIGVQDGRHLIKRAWDEMAYVSPRSMVMEVHGMHLALKESAYMSIGINMPPRVP